MKNRTMSSYKHVLKERYYKESERNRIDDERNKKRSKDNYSKHSSHTHKSRRSNSPHRSSHHRKSPLKSKIETYDNSNYHRKRKHHESEISESYEELSKRKKKLESELRALDLEEAAQKEAENKRKTRKEKTDNKVPDVKAKPPSRSDDKDKRSSKLQNIVEKEKHKGHASKSSESDKNWGKSQQESKDLKKEKPNFEVSGKLAEETNTYNGIVIKYNEPSEARKPKRRWRLYPFKGDSVLPYIPIHRQSAYLFGRTRLIADIPIDHPSCSKQHAVLQYRLVPYKREDGTTGRRVRPYIIDLESSNGTFVNNKKIQPRCYVELIEKDVIKFGYSSREYVLLHEETKDNEYDDDVIENDSNK